MAIRFCTTAAELKTALAACVPGDVIKLDHTKVFEGQFVLRNMGVVPLGQEVLLTGDNDPTTMPPSGYRLTPQYFSLLPKVQGTRLSNYRNESVLKTESGANGYRIKWIDFVHNFWGGGEMITIGIDSPAQTEYSQQPSNIYFDQVYAHGDPMRGQKRGMGLHGKDLRVTNSWFEDFKGVGQDAMCLTGMNGEGPVLIENNHFEGAGYCIIWGGSDVRIKTQATVISATTTSLVLSTIKDLSIGQLIAIRYQNNADGQLRRKHPRVKTIDSATNTVTFDDIGVIADIPGMVNWGVQLRHITVRRNHFTKDLIWRNPVLPAPSTLNNPTAVSAAVGLAPGTYYYKVSASINPHYDGSTIYSPASIEKSIVISALSQVNLSWPQVTDVPTGFPATSYRVYRYQKDAAGVITGLVYFTTSNLNFSDTGAAGTAVLTSTGAPATSIPGGDRWVIKNLYEHKTGTDVLIAQNVFEYAWRGSDIGYAVWIKNNSSDDSATGQPWSELHDLVLEWNLFRHTAGWVSYSGIQNSGKYKWDTWPEPPYNVTYRNNLIYDSNADWGNDGYATGMENGPKNTIWDHNTVLRTQVNGAQYFSSNTNENSGPFLNTKWTNNIWIHLSYGFKGANAISGAIGKDAIVAHTGGVYQFEKNVVQGANPSLYNFAPAVNYYPDLTTFSAQFKRYDTLAKDGDFRLKRISEGDNIDSAWINQGTDGKDIGCDVATLNVKIAGVIEGLPETIVPPVTPPETSNVDSKVITFAAATALGDQFIDVGFAPKAILFFWGDHIDDGETNAFNIGMGAACIDGSKWTGQTSVADNTATSDVGNVMKTTACISKIDPAPVLQREANVSNWGLTGFTLNWTTISATPHLISALVLGGNGVQNAKAFSFPTRTTLGTDDINLGFQPNSLIFFTPNSRSLPLPMFTSKNTIYSIGLCDQATSQGYIVGRVKNAVNPSSSYRAHGSGYILGAIDDTQTVIRALVQNYLATGFRLNYDIVNGSADNYFGLAIKGPRSLFQIITEPAGTGNVSYGTQWRPEGIILAGAYLATPGGQTTHARFTLGAASEPTEKSVIFSGHRNATTPMVSKDRINRSRVYSRFTEGNVATDTEADISSISGSSFTLAWSGNPGSTDLLALAIGAAPTVVIGQPIILAAITEAELIIEADLSTQINLASTLYADIDIIAPLSVVRALNHSVTALFALRINLDVKREIDSGEVVCLASDAGGTNVLFNKAFKDIDSITLTVKGTVPRLAIYDFVDIPNPVNFKIYVYDQTGARQNATVSWKARGII